MSSSTALAPHRAHPPPWEVQALPPAEWETFYSAVLNAFHEAEPDEATALWRSLGEPERCVVVRDGGTVTGTAGIFSFLMAVPGEHLVQTAGVTMVSVRPTHRRRGILSALMHHQLESLQRQGEPLAVLTASEAPIYERFGYGVAARQLSLDIQSRRVGLRTPATDEVELVLEDPYTALDTCEEFYARRVPTRPGRLARGDGWEMLVLEIEDALAPWNRGRWRLSGDQTGAVCSRTYDAPDLSLDTSALGAAYLGGTTLSELAAAGRVREHKPGSLPVAAAAFASPVAPWLPHSFCRSLLPRL